MSSYTISKKLNPKKVFILQKSELEKRFDPSWYVYLKSIEGFKQKSIPLKELLISNPQYGANEIGIERNSVSEPRYIRITDINEFGEFDSGTYLRLPKEDEAFVKSNIGCTIFRKINYFNDDEQIIINTNLTPWLPGHGNLEVMPLSTQTALVKWAKGERFIPHKHWGGEEILVLSGTFIDEHGTYPQGSWIRSPHLSEHFPYVEEETIIFVKTGHL